MSPTTEKVIASCSFCGKPNTRVKKLIAGPGIFICDECVGLCQEIVQAEAPALEPGAAEAAYESRPAEEVLGLLAGAARTIESIEATLAGWVGRLRSAGVSWQDIGARLGISADAAAGRFGAAS